VSVKSRTSLLRARSRRRRRILESGRRSVSQLDGASCLSPFPGPTPLIQGFPRTRSRVNGRERWGKRAHIPKHTRQHPAQPQRPPHSSVAPNAAPTKNKIKTEGFPGGERGEEDEGRGNSVEGQLEGQNLGC